MMDSKPKTESHFNAWQGRKAVASGLAGKNAVKALEKANKMLGNGIAYSILQDKSALDEFVSVLKDARRWINERCGNDGMNMRYAGFYKLGGIVAKMKRGEKLAKKEKAALESAIETLVRAFYLKDVDLYIGYKAEPAARKIIAELEMVGEKLVSFDSSTYPALSLLDDIRLVSKALQ